MSKYSKSINVRLPDYQFYIHASGLVSPVILASLIYLFPSHFSFLKEPGLVFLFFVGIFAFHTFFMFVEYFSNNKAYFAFPRYGWLVVFCAIVYVSGGISSPVIYLLILPYLVSTVDLNAKDTLIVSCLTMTFLVGLFLYDPREMTPETVGQHLFTIFIFSIISLYMYRLVKETLHERFEKEEVKAEVSRLLELDKVKSDFITVASHRLRTPLSGVVWALSEISDPESDNLSISKRKEIEASALHETNEAIKVVNDLIRSVEIDSQSYKLNILDVDLEMLIHEVIESLAWLARKNNVTVSVTGDKLPDIKGDKEMLRLSIANMIDNAIRYSPNATVQVRWGIKDDTVIIYINDSGSGISPDDLKYVFERFYRGQNALSIEPNASGVGLYIAKKLIELHTGSVALTSEKGRGTNVIIKLPLWTKIK